MNLDQLRASLQELTDLLGGVTRAIPGGADCTVAELTEYLALATTNQLQLAAVHKALEGVRPGQRRTA